MQQAEKGSVLVGPSQHMPSVFSDLAFNDRDWLLLQVKRHAVLVVGLTNQSFLTMLTQINIDHVLFDTVDADIVETVAVDG
jgi:hypothetical protein